MFSQESIMPLSLSPPDISTTDELPGFAVL